MVNHPPEQNGTYFQDSAEDAVSQAEDFGKGREYLKNPPVSQLLARGNYLATTEGYNPGRSLAYACRGTESFCTDSSTIFRAKSGFER
jgi:hypothetical protein